MSETQIALAFPRTTDYHPSLLVLQLTTTLYLSFSSGRRPSLARNIIYGGSRGRSY